MNTAYILGLVCGILAVALVCWVVVSINRKKGKSRTEYDERQQALRDKGFRYAFFTLVGYLALFAFIHSLGIVWCETAGGIFIGVMLSLMVQIIYSIYRDAYIKPSERPGYYVELLAAMGFGNVVMGVLRRIDGSASGLPGIYDINLIAGLSILIIWLNLLIKFRLERRDDGEGRE